MPTPAEAVEALLAAVGDILGGSSLRLGIGPTLVLLAILLPPLGVFLQVGLGLHFWLNILLTLLGYIPSIVHAIWIIVRR